MTDRRYFDSDVRGNPQLIDMAVDYVWDYPGDFEFLVAARELARLTDTLPTGLARGVLNCMRNDPHVAGSMPEPPRLTSTTKFHQPSWSEVRDDRPRRPAPPPPPPSRLEVSVSVKVPYGISSFRGYKTHIVRDARCYLDKHKGYHGQPSGHPTYPWMHFEVYWACAGDNHYRQSTSWPILFRYSSEDTDWCQKCLEAEGEEVLCGNL